MSSSARATERLSATAIQEVLREEGFARLPRRAEEERPNRARPSAEAVADVRTFSLAERSFTTHAGGLFLRAQARQIFRRFLDTSARVSVSEQEVTVQLPRRAHNPLLIDAGLIGRATKIPWWNGRPLRLEIV